MLEPLDETRITLSLEQIEHLKPFGDLAEAPAGTVLVEEGDREPDMIVVLDGEIEVFHLEAGTRQEALIGVMTPGTFLGELNVLTGETTFCFTSTFTGTTVPGWAPLIRPAGRGL